MNKQVTFFRTVLIPKINHESVTNMLPSFDHHFSHYREGKKYKVKLRKNTEESTPEKKETNLINKIKGNKMYEYIALKYN